MITPVNSEDIEHLIRLQCACGHQGAVTMKGWKHRDVILARARCTACGRRGAESLSVYSKAAGKNFTGVDD